MLIRRLKAAFGKTLVASINGLGFGGAKIVDCVNISKYNYSQLPVTKAYEHYQSIIRGGSKDRWHEYKDYDWARFHYIMGRLENGDKALDVGVLTGQFLDSLRLSGRYRQVIGIDVELMSGFTMRSGNSSDVKIMSVAALDFHDNSFDVVICSEVLEHLTDSDFQTGLQHLRRVCRKQLVMSVPFNERPPLCDGHCRTFKPKDLLHTFPNARFTLLYTDGYKLIRWVLIEEYCSMLNEKRGRLRSLKARLQLEVAAAAEEAYEFLKKAYHFMRIFSS